MTIEQIDALLADRQKKLGETRQRLEGQTARLVYKLLAGDPGRGITPAELIDSSAKIIPDMIALVGDLEAALRLTDNCFHQANNIRQNLPTLMKASKLEEIERLLTSNLITVPTTLTPLLKRGKLSAGAATIEQVLAAIDEAIPSCTQTIDQVDNAWHLSKDAKDKLDADAASLQARADALGAGKQTGLDMAKNLLSNAGEKWLKDPIGQLAKYNSQVKALVESIKQHLDLLEKDKEDVLTDIARAHIALQQLKDRNGAAGKISDLEARLNVLDKRIENKEWQQARIGLELWFAIAEGRSVPPPRSTVSPANTQATPTPSTTTTTTTTHQQPATRPTAKASPDPRVVDGGYRPPVPDALDDLLGNGHFDTAPRPATQHQAPAAEDPELDKVLGQPTKPKDKPKDDLDDVLDSTTKIASKSKSAPPTTITPETPVEVVLKKNQPARNDEDPLDAMLDEGRKKPARKDKTGNETASTATATTLASTSGNTSANTPANTPTTAPANTKDDGDALDDLLSGAKKKKTKQPSEAADVKAPVGNAQVSTSQPDQSGPKNPLKTGKSGKSLDDLFGE